ncbi:MAG: D-aminoacyl-tRNA deacylase [Akkermansiaceae bacterium]
MRVVIQRAQSAQVVISGEVHGAIQRGVVVLVGIEHDDSLEDAEWLCRKVANLRIFDDEAGVMNLSLTDIAGEALIISQFTLHASTKKGNRPSYIKAARPEISKPLYEKFITTLNSHLAKPCQTGKFGADMQVSLTNDGPVTIVIDTKNKE